MVRAGLEPGISGSQGKRPNHWATPPPEIKRVVDERKSQKERARLRVLEEAKERWIALGMMRGEDAHLLDSVTGPYHPNIERSRDKYFSPKKEEERRLLERKAREYFDNEWVMEKEKELQELQRNEDAATDPDIKKAIHYMTEITVKGLKLRFQMEEVPGLAKLVLLERRKKAVDMQWVSPAQAQRVNSIWCPLPYPCEEMEHDDEQDLFMTPSTAPKADGQSSSPKRKSQKRQSQQSRTPVPKRGKITHFFSPSQDYMMFKFHIVKQELLNKVRIWLKNWLSLIYLSIF